MFEVQLVRLAWEEPNLASTIKNCKLD